jgi:hypothetical protein
LVGADCEFEPAISGFVCAAPSRFDSAFSQPLYAPEAKGEGFDVKVLREILRLRKLDREDHEEHESLVDLYLRAMESSGKPEVRAA